MQDECVQEGAHSRRKELGLQYRQRHGALSIPRSIRTSRLKSCRFASPSTPLFGSPSLLSSVQLSTRGVRRWESACLLLTCHVLQGEAWTALLAKKR